MVGIREEGDALSIDVLVQPRASRNQIGPVHDDRLKIAVTAPPVDGAANTAVVKLVASRLKCPRRDVEVVSGASSRRKKVRIRGITRDALMELTR